jgi:hypothetical protein
MQGIKSYWLKSLAAVAVLGLAMTAQAQDASTGSISGTITDASGAAVKGATVRLVNTDRNQTIRTIMTNGAGFYTGTSLPLGTYTVHVEDSGFKPVNVTGLILHTSDALTVNRALSAGGASETVTVSADEARVNLEDPTAAGLINSEQLNEMPLLTRNYETLLNLQPGVAFGGASDQLMRGPSGLSGSSSTVAFSVNGGRTTSNNWTIDGADNLDRGANLTLYVYPSPDSIAEFKTLRGQYSAQFGRNSSGQIDVITKSGTNSLHGSAYEYFRNDFLDANGYGNNFLGQRIPKYRYNVFGFSVGGPVWIPKLYNGKNKTFFFVSEEWQRIVSYNSGVTALVPTAAERTGDFSQSGYIPTGSTTWTTGPISVCTAYTTNPATQVNTCTATGTQVPAANISPLAQGYLKDVYSKIPLPQTAFNQSHNLDPHTFTSTFANTFNNLDSVVRIDQQVGQKLNVFYRYVHDTFPTYQSQGQFVASPIPGLNPTVSLNPGTQHLGKGTYVFSPTLLMNIGYAYSNGSVNSDPAGFLSSSLSPDINPNLIYANTTGLIPSISVSGLTALTGSILYRDHGINHQAFGDVTKTFHNHTFIGGVSYNRFEKTENATGGGTQGSFSFTNDTAFTNVPKNTQTGAATAQSFANFLTGNANAGFSQSSKITTVDLHAELYEAFLQDNWKVNPRLTLNLGVRYAYYGQPYDANGQLSSFDPARYNASKAPTVASTGLICFASPCSQANSNAGLPTTANANADYVGVNYINGMIFGTPNAANNNQGSGFGDKVGQAQKTNFAPRFGFAFDVFGDGKTSLRGGYGWAFDNAEVSYYETSVFNNPPSVSSYSIGQTSLDNPAGGGTSTTPSTTPGRIQAVPVDYKTPYTQQFSLDLQQQLSAKTFLDVGYFGTHGTHLLGALNINQPAPGAWVGKVVPQSSGSACLNPDTNTASFLNSTCDRVLNQIRPYQGYFAVDALRTIFSSNYNALQVKFTKKFSGKTYFDANYTWSRDLTNSQADYSGFVQNIYNINADYGRAAVDRTNILTLDGVFELPFYRDQKGFKGRLIGGWELSGIYAINSGLPLSVSASSAYSPSYNLPGNGVSIFNGRTNTGYITDNAGLGVLGNTNAGIRLDQLGNPNNGYGTPIHNKGYHQLWFYPGAFAAANQNSNVPATARRGTIEGPGFNRLDLGVFRNFRIYDRLAFQFRAEAFNAANHTNVNSVSTAAGSATTFGQVTGYRDARILQFAGKFTF